MADYRVLIGLVVTELVQVSIIDFIVAAIIIIMDRCTIPVLAIFIVYFSTFIEQCPDINLNGRASADLRARGLSPGISYTNMRILGSIATHQCRGGLVAVGNLTRTCIRNASSPTDLIWSQPVPLCVGKYTKYVACFLLLLSNSSAVCVIVSACMKRFTLKLLWFLFYYCILISPERKNVVMLSTLRLLSKEMLM